MGKKNILIQAIENCWQSVYYAVIGNLELPVGNENFKPTNPRRSQPLLRRLIQAALTVLLVLSVTVISFGQECGVIYCSPAGMNASAGTKADPVDLSTGLSMVNGANSKLYLREGTYVLSQSLVMISNVSIVGGFNQNWEKSNSALTTIFRDPSNIQVGPPRLIGVECVGLSNFKLQDLTIQAANAVGEGVTTYAVYLRNCADYDIVRCRIIAGNGGNGNFGDSGTPGVFGSNGEPGQPGNEDGAGNRTGGISGSGGFAGSLAGGLAGDGGERGTYEFPAGGDAFPGYEGLQGQGMFGGFGGDGGLEIFTTIISTSCDRTPANDGDPGNDGGPGTPGLLGQNGQSAQFGGFFNPGSGTSGSDGTHGSGGGGGGGGGSQGGIFWIYIPWPVEDTIPPNSNGSGAGGGGGGEGGQAGTGGLGGQGGGGSFAVYTYDNGFNGILKDCELQSGLSGIGGFGGLGGPGGSGGPGGAGGGLQNCDIGAGGNGGEGGQGGSGGQGGNGSNGITEEIYEDDLGQPLVLQNIYGLSQPLVTVNYSGCTDSPVQFSVEGSGTAQWFFGAGAEPYSQFGIEAVTSYETLGDKTFTLVLNGVAYTYTFALDIRLTAPTAPPQINSSTIDLCEGDGGNFTSSVAGDIYYWQLSTENDTTEFSGPGFQVLNHIFDTAATYQLTLQTETACCGKSFADTITIVVDSIIPPSVEVQSDLFGAGIGCQASNITFTAAAVDVGSSASYQWTINGSNAGLDQPVFTTNALVDGDQVNCVVTSSLGCATGQTAQGIPIAISLIPPPEATCEVDSFIAGDPTHYLATITSAGLPPYEYFWTFGDGTFGFGEDIYHIYDDGGFYTVQLTVVDSNGCEAHCQTQIDVASFFSVDFNINGLPIDSMSGCAPLSVPFENVSVNATSQFWDFGDGQFSNEESPSHVYTTPGIYAVTLFAYSETGGDSATVENLINVLPNPTASFQPIQVNPEEGADTVQFADNSLGADSWSWNFGDPGSGAENFSDLSNPFHVYENNGSYTATLIVTNQFGCADTISIAHGVNVGIEEINDLISVYPNPTTGLVYLSVSDDVSESNIRVIDLVGKSIKNVNVTSRSLDGLIVLDLSQLEIGTYFISVFQDERELNIPIVVVGR